MTETQNKDIEYKVVEKLIEKDAGLVFPKLPKDFKVSEEIKSFGGVDAYLKNDKEISGLFKGYPDFFT